MSTRYDNKAPLENSEDIYQDAFEARGIKKLRQFSTANLRHPTPLERTKLERVGHVWAVGDRFYKLAHKYYGNSKYWWVIAWYNQLPTESHIELGDIVIIPTPVEDAIQILKEGTSK